MITDKTSNGSELREKELFPINSDQAMAAILLLYLVITLLTLTNYSDAWDNVSMFQYGQDSAKIFRHPFQHYYQQEYGPVDLRYFGPFLVTISYLIDQTIGGLVFLSSFKAILFGLDIILSNLDSDHAAIDFWASADQSQGHNFLRHDHPRNISRIKDDRWDP